MSRDLKILLFVIGLCALGASFLRGPGRRPVVPARPDTRAWAHGPAPPHVRGLEKVFYGLYFFGPDVSMTVVPGIAGQVDCVYSLGDARWHCMKPRAWYDSLLGRLANAGITCSRYEYFSEDECHLDLTYDGPPQARMCGTSLIHKADHPEEYPIAQGTRAEVAALALVRAAVAELIAKPATGSSLCMDSDDARQTNQWTIYYSDYPYSAVMQLAGRKHDDLSQRGFNEATDRIEQEFVARYRTVPVTSTN